MRNAFFTAAALFLGFGVVLLIPACSQNNSTTGPTGPQGPAGTSAVPTPYCNNPTSHGMTISGGVTTTGTSAGNIYADAVTLTDTVGISLSVNVAAGSGPVTGQVRMAIYANNGTAPGILVAKSASQPTVAGWNTLSIQNVYLPAGTYWIAFMFSSLTNETFNTSGGISYYVNYGWGEYPTTFPTGTAITEQDALYISTCP